MLDVLTALGDRTSAAIIWAADVIFSEYVLIPILFGVGIFMTVRLRFVQVVRFKDAARTLVPAAQAGAKGPLSPFQAFMTALGASIGTGNIAGVATAIVTGGPGALFWIWVYGFFATAIKFSEAVLGIRYRRIIGDRLSAGPMHYLRDGLGSPALAWAYAAIAAVAALTTTPMSQPNSIAVAWKTVLGVPQWATGVGLAILTWLVVIGGVTSIGRAAEKLAPAKVFLYLVGGLVVIVTHFANLPAMLSLVVHEALSIGAVTGGTAGVGVMVAMRYGLARGIYANEAGYGTAAVAYGTARSDRPAQQGLNAVMEVFIVSFVTSSISGLTILVSGAWRSGSTSSAVVAEAFNSAMPTVGGWILAFCVFLFGYTTLTGWAYYGEQFLEYVCGTRVTILYRWVYCALIVLGATSKVETVWAWGDLMNGLQVIPNLIGLVGLSGVAWAILRDSRETPPAA
jgi:alanine or glycine:cation symporter, AGCS family